MYSESKVDYYYFSSRITLRPEEYLKLMKALVVFRQLLLKLKASVWQDEIRVHMYIEMYALRSNIKR